MGAPAAAGPSQLLDPGEWLAVSDDFADQAREAEPGSHERAAAFAGAAAALDEVQRFGPPDAERVPAALIRSELGRAVHDAEPGRLRRARIDAVRRGYRVESGESVAEPAGAPLLPRTQDEEQAYLHATPCVCGRLLFEPDEYRITIHDGEAVVLYQAPCDVCGRGRAYWFRAPEHQARFAPAGHGYGPPGGGPSRLLDAGQWLLLAGLYGMAADGIAADGIAQDADAAEVYHGSVQVLARAVGALDEVLRFAPGHSARVPASACWDPAGVAVYRAEPARFECALLQAERDRRAAALAAFLATHPEPPPPPDDEDEDEDDEELEDSWRP